MDDDQQFQTVQVPGGEYISNSDKSSSESQTQLPGNMDVYFDENYDFTDGSFKGKSINQSLLNSEIEDLRKKTKLKRSPLDEIDRQELGSSFINLNQQIGSRAKQITLPLCTLRPQYNQDYLQVLKVTFHSRINEVIYQQEVAQLGRVKCVVSAGDILAVGGSLGTVLVQDPKQNDFKVFAAGNQGSITSLDVSSDMSLLAVGFENGAFSLIDLTKESVIQCFPQMHSGSILTCKFLSNVGTQLEKIIVVSSDDCGHTMFSRFFKSFFQIERETRVLVPHQKFPIQNIQVLGSQLMGKYIQGSEKHNEQIVAISSICQLWVLLIDWETPKVVTIFTMFNKDIKEMKTQHFFSCLSWGQGFLKKQKKQQKEREYTSEQQIKSILDDMTLISTTPLRKNSTLFSSLSSEEDRIDYRLKMQQMNREQMAQKKKNKKQINKLINLRNSEEKPQIAPSLLIVFGFEQTLYLGVVQVISQQHLVTPSLNEGTPKTNRHAQFENKICIQVSKKIDCMEPVLHCSFISPSVIVLIDYSHSITVFNTTELDCIFQNENQMEATKKVVFKVFKQTNFSQQAQNLILFSPIQINGQLMAQTFAMKNEGIIQKKVQEENQTGEIDKEMMAALNSVPFQLYHHSFALNTEDFQITFLTQNSLGVAELTSWENMISQMMVKEEFLMAMHFLIYLKNGHYQFVANLKSDQVLRHLQLRESIQIVSTKFLQFIFKIKLIEKKRTTKKKSHEEEQNAEDLIFNKFDQIVQINPKKSKFDNFVQILIEFLLVMDSEDLLFDEIIEVFKAHFGSSDSFIKSLEPFIILNRIRFIPNSGIIEVVQYFKSQKNYPIIQHFLLAIDLTSINVSPLIKICLEIGLIHSLIYLCTKGSQSEILTPLHEFWGQYKKYQREEKNEFLSNQTAIRALWYIRLSLQRQLINGQIFTEAKFEKIVEKLCEWVFKGDFLVEVFSQSAQATFEVLLIFFEQKQEQIINRSQSLGLEFSQVEKDWIQFDIRRSNLDNILAIIINSFQRSLQLKSGKDEGFFKDERVGDEISSNSTLANQDTSIPRILGNQVEKEQEDLDFNISRILKNKKIQPVQVIQEYVEDSPESFLTIFVARIIKLGRFKIAKSQILSTIHYLVQNPRVFDRLNIDLEKLKKILVSPKFEQLDENTFNSMAKEIAYSDFILNILQTIMPSVTMSEINQLQKICSLSRFTEVSVFLLRHQKQYTKCIDQFFETNNFFVRDKVFACLWEILLHMEFDKDKANFELMKENIVRRLTDLIKISIDNTRDLVNRFLKSAQFSIVMKLEYMPQLQYDYITRILQERERGVQIDPEILKIHLKLLCQLYPEKVITELDEFCYPLDDALSICQQSGNKQGQAYLMERLGNFQLSHSIQHQLFQSQVKSFWQLKKFQKDAIKKRQLENSLKSRLQCIFSLCQKYQQREESLKNQLWFLTLDRGILIQLQYSEKGDEYISQTLMKQIGLIIEEISKNIPLDVFISILKSEYQNLNYQELSPTFRKIIFNYSYMQNILDIAVDWIQENYEYDQRKLYSELKMGIFSHNICEYCQKEIGRQGNFSNYLVFNCGHVYHHSCLFQNNQSLQLYEKVCPKCFQEENIIMIMVNKLPANKGDSLAKSQDQYALGGLAGQDNLQKNQENSLEMGHKNIGNGDKRLNEVERSQNRAALLNQQFGEYDQSLLKNAKQYQEFLKNNQFI